MTSGYVALTIEDSEPTKRSVVSISARFFDPLGIISPVTVLFKIFCQKLCEAKVGWDESWHLCTGYKEQITNGSSSLRAVSPPYEVLFSLDIGDTVLLTYPPGA